MFTLPEWAPHVHPLIVHFPIAILFVAAFADFFALVWHRHIWLRWTASGLYALGALSAVVAFYTGRDAAESVYLSGASNALLTDHANWAEWTIWVYGVYAIARLVVERQRFGNLKAVQALLFVVGAVNLFLVKETGEHGAQLVYQHGVGVASFAIDIEPQEVKSDSLTGALAHRDSTGGHHTDELAIREGHQHGHSEEGATHALSEVEVTPNGWSWDVGHNGVTEFEQKFQMIAGEWSDVQVGVDHDHLEGDVLTLQINGRPILLTAGPPIAGVQYNLRLNAAAFTGAIRLLHHVQDVENYNFMEINNKEVTLGRMVKGEVRVEDRGSFSESGWLDLRVVGDGTHFRGYVNKKMVVHGHGKEPALGPVGLHTFGTGVLMFDAFDVQKLR